MPVPHIPPHPVVRRLRSQAHILHGSMGLGDNVHRVPVVPQSLDDLLGQVGLAGPRKARQQQAPVQTVAHRVLHSAPRRLRSDRLRFHAGLPILPPQPGHFLVAIDGRAVPVRHLQQPLHGRAVLLRDVLHHQAIGLDTLQVAPGHVRQSLPNPRHCDILGPHDEVMNRPVAAV